MQSRQDLLTAVYAAFNRRDIGAILGLMRPDVDWPNGMEAGRLHRCDKVRGYWKRQWSIIDPHAEPVRMEEDEDGNIVVSVHQVVRDLSGKILTYQIVEHVYSLWEGLIERMEIRNPIPRRHTKVKPNHCLSANQSNLSKSLILKRRLYRNNLG